MNPNRAHDAAVGELSSILPGDNLAVFYSDDTVWHERIVLWPAKRGTGSGHIWWVVTPDFDVYPEDLHDPEEGPSRVRIRGKTFKYWSRFSSPTYRFAEALTDEDRQKYMTEAIQQIKAAGDWEETDRPSKVIDARGSEVLPHNYLRILVPRRLPPRGGGVMAHPVLENDMPGATYTEELAGLVSPIRPAPDGYLWVAAEFSKDKKPGDEVEVRPGRGVMVGFKTALIPVREGFLKVRKVKIEDIPVFAEEVRGFHREEPVGHLRRDLGIEKDPEATREATAEEPEDARVLGIDYDAQGQKYKEMRQVVQESEEFSWKDWPMEGPLCTLHLLKQMFRNGGSPKHWLQTWARYKAIQENDRIMFEMRTLVDAVELGCCYDQLNCPALASFEVLSRRIMAIVDAFSAGTTGSPDWGAARVITGYKGPEDVLSPQLRQWAARKGKEETDLHQARLKMREGRRGLSEEAGAVADGSLPASAAPKKGEGKKKGRGRGLTPPAAE